MSHLRFLIADFWCLVRETFSRENLIEGLKLVWLVVGLGAITMMILGTLQVVVFLNPIVVPAASADVLVFMFVVASVRWWVHKDARRDAEQRAHSLDQTRDQLWVDWWTSWIEANQMKFILSQGLGTEPRIHLRGGELRVLQVRADSASFAPIQLDGPHLAQEAVSRLRATGPREVVDLSADPGPDDIIH